MSRAVSPRTIAALVFVAGLAIGSVADVDVVTHRTPARAGGYWILAGDFHVHAFPGDGALAPWALLDEARRAGLDVLAVTNHNTVWSSRFAQWVAGLSDGPIVLMGEEITSPGYHLIAVGLERAVLPNPSAAAAIADVHAQGGVAIAAHPTRRFRGWDAAAVVQLDGTEVAHPASDEKDQNRRDFAAFFARARALKPDVSPIGSSDFHTALELARCRTLVFALEPTAAGVLEAIRRGRTVAEDAGGRRYGDAHLVRLLETAPPSGRTNAHPIWRMVSVSFAWLGLLGMLVCGRERSASRPRHRRSAVLTD